MIAKFREPVNGLTHLIAAVAAALGVILLLWISRNDISKWLPLTIYGTSLVLMFSASGSYHSINANDTVMRRLRKLDHSAIYLLIAGSYTPICLYFFEGFWRWGLLAIIWSMAIGGIAVKLFIINAPRWVTAGIYLIMGWLAVMAMNEMLLRMPTGALIWLLVGGIFFTLGAIVYITKKMDFYPGVFGFHEVWHIFVILGCLSHFIVVAFYIAP